MNPMKHLFPFLALLVVFSACSRDRNPFGLDSKAGFALHFLADSTLGPGQVLERDIRSLPITAEPWISSEDVDMVDFSSHLVYLKGPVRDWFALFPEASLPTVQKPFVAVADGQPCYVGFLWGAALSSIPSAPTILAFPFPGPDSCDVIAIEKNRLPASGQENDERNDPRIRDALIRTGIFHAGLSVTLHTAVLVRNGDPSLVEYEYTVRNNDRDALYVLDPDSEEPEVFSHYVSGPFFIGQSGTYIWPEHGASALPEPGVLPRTEAFTRIESGGSIRRSVRLSTYPRFPRDRYRCCFTFSGPVWIPRDRRNLADGRIWLGQIETDELVLDLW
jgi:hypothetical protein